MHRLARHLIVLASKTAAFGLSKDLARRLIQYGDGAQDFAEAPQQMHCLNLLQDFLHYSDRYRKAPGETKLSNDNQRVHWHVSLCLDLTQPTRCILGRRRRLRPTVGAAPADAALARFLTSHSLEMFKKKEKKNGAWGEQNQVEEDQAVDWRYQNVGQKPVKHYPYAVELTRRRAEVLGPRS